MRVSLRGREELTAWVQQALALATKKEAEMIVETVVAALEATLLIRTILLHDAEGKEALETLRDFLKKHPQPNPNGLIFHSRHERYSTPRKQCAARWLAPGFAGTRSASGWLARLSSWLQPEVGIVWFESRRHSSADGA